MRHLLPFFALLFLLSHLCAADSTSKTADQSYALAVGRFGMGLHAEAAAQLERFIKAHPQDNRIPQAHYLLGECRVTEKKYGTALAAFQSAANSKVSFPKQAESFFRIAEMHQLTNRMKEATEAFNTFLTRYPNHALKKAALEKQAQTLTDHLYNLMEKTPNAVLPVATQAAKRSDSAGEEGLYLLTTLHFNKGEHEKAVTHGKDLITRFPASSRLDACRLTVANAHLALKQSGKALEHLNAIKNFRPDEVHFLRGTLLKEGKKMEEAKSCFTKVIGEHPKSEYHPYALFELGTLNPDHQSWKALLAKHAAHELAAEAACRWAAELIAKGQNGEARKLLDAVPASSPRRADAERLLIHLGAKSDPAQAAARLDALAQAKKGGKDLPTLRYSVGLALLEKNDGAGAAKQFAAVLADPAGKALHAESLYRLGLAREKEKKATEALMNYARLLKEFGGHTLVPFALLRLGALNLEKDRTAAAQHLESLLKNHPKFPHRSQAQSLLQDVQYRSAWDHYKKKEHAKAAPLFLALKAHPKYGAESSYLAGIAYQTAKNRGAAEEAFRHCLKAHPKYQYAGEAQRLLGEILVAGQKWQAAATHYTAMLATATADKARGELSLKQGMALYQLNQLTRATASFKAAIEKGEPYVKARATFFLGEIAFQQKRYGEARDHFLNVSILYNHPELTPAALLEAAKCFGQMGQKDKRDKLLKTLLAKHGKSPHAKTARELIGK
ncbi:MAG: tetratricopeptide repeat protein [Planctomycetota bacterium]|jgi:TolA-binding protein